MLSATTWMSLLSPAERATIIQDNTPEQDWSIIKSIPVDGDGVQRTKKLRREIDPRKLAVHDKYKAASSIAKPDWKLDPRAATFLKNHIAEWTERHKAEIEKDQIPYGIEYWLDLRMQCICRNEGITEQHADMVCKSSINSIMKKQAAAKATFKQIVRKGKSPEYRANPMYNAD